MIERLKAKVFDVNEYRAFAQIDDGRVALVLVKDNQPYMRHLQPGDVVSFDPRPISNPGRGPADLFAWTPRIEEKAAVAELRHEAELWAGWLPVEAIEAKEKVNDADN